MAELSKDVLDHFGAVFAVEDVAQDIEGLLLDRDVITCGLEGRVFF